MEGSFSNPGFLQLDLIEEGRREIYKWREKRRTKRSGLQGRIYELTKLFIDRSLVQSFINNLSIVVGFQMLLAALCTYACVQLELEFDVHMSLFVSPIVFPLAFSINANYQRREEVLEDLAMFKAASMILFFCHRDWIKAVGMPVDLLKTLSNKLKFLVVNIAEYLLTEASQKRNVILQAIYEDFSDIAQLNDKIRASELKSNSALVARIIHCHNLMCWSFEKLRVIREYKSPRSLRSFTKVFIFLMPLLLSPYYVYSGRRTRTAWAPYYISVLVSFLFGSLQAVQDKLDDPFDGISEDDVNLGQLDDWTTQSFLTNRTVTIGRFTVTTTTAKEETSNTSPLEVHFKQQEETVIQVGSPKRIRRGLSRKHERRAESRRTVRPGLDDKEFSDQLEARCHGLTSKLEGLTGSSTILPGNRTAYVFKELQGLKSPEMASVMVGSLDANTKNDDELDERDRVVDSSRKTSIQFVFTEESDSDLRENDDDDSKNVVPDSHENLLKSDVLVRPEEKEREKRPTVMELFAKDAPLKPDESGTKENELRTKRVSRSKTTSPSSTVSSESEPLNISPSTSHDASLTQDSFAAPAVRTGQQTSPSGSETELQRSNSLPRLKFSGKKRTWSVAGSVSKWRKRRDKKKPSSFETVQQLESENELTNTSSLSPLLHKDKHQENKRHNSKEDLSRKVNRSSELKASEVKTTNSDNSKQDDGNKSPVSGKNGSRFLVLRENASRDSDEQAIETKTSQKNGSRFSVTPS